MGCSFASLFLESLLLVLLRGTLLIRRAGMAGIMLLPATRTSPRNCCGLCFQETLNNSSCTLEAPINTCLALAGVICTGYWQHLLQQVLIKNTQAFPAQTSIHTAFCALHNSSCLTFSSRANEIVESGKCACGNSPWGPGYGLPPAHMIELCVWFIVHMLMCAWPSLEVKCTTDNSVELF